MLKKVTIQLLIVLAVGWVIWNASPAAAEVDYSIYAELLQAHVKDGVVNYKGFKKNEGKLDRFLDILDQTDFELLPEKEHFAYMVNAYNACTIKLILTEYPNIKSIKDLGGLFSSPWKKRFCRLGGRVFTLDEIEHEILRPRYKDPRIHFAVNCASKSCPPLISEPYVGARLDEQLDRSTRDFINDPDKNRLDGNVLYISKIFKWYGEDFNEDPIAFFIRYINPKAKELLDKNRGDIKIKYLDYDWSLNGD